MIELLVIALFVIAFFLIPRYEFTITMNKPEQSSPSSNGATFSAAAGK